MKAHADQKKLGLWQTVSMSMGGMMGGIFPVLGEAVGRAGSKAFWSFGLAGVLALITGISYSRLSCGLGASGAKVVNCLAGTPVGGTLNWSLLVGYILTNSLYAAAFGRFAVKLLGFGNSVYVASGALVLFGALNLSGVKLSGRLQALLVQFQFLLLLVLGIAASSAGRGTEETVHVGPALLLGLSGLVLVAYEGFELLSYSYEEIGAVLVNLPWATWISVLATTLLYALLAFGVGRVDGAGTGVLAAAGLRTLGVPGYFLVIVAALLATAAAINATFFASARLARRITLHRQLPPVFGTWLAGQASVPFVVVMLVAALALQFLAHLEQMVSFASFAFLILFAVFNFLAAAYRPDPRWTLLPFLGGCGCLGALGFFSFELYSEQPKTLRSCLGIALLLLVIRVLHLKGKRLPELEQ